MAKTHVILTAGHRNGTAGGAPGEPALTLRYAAEYATVLAARGFTIHYLQRMVPAPGKPDWFDGSLSDVAKKVAAVAGSLPAGDAVAMIDVHMEAPGAGNGMFAIVPDGRGLNGAEANTPDTWENNTESRRLGHAIIKEMSLATGIPQRFARELGLMSEKQSGVATEKHSRLAMFRHTASLWERMPRLVVEHGSLSADKVLLNASGTPAKCAEAMARALHAHFGTAEPAPPPVFAPLAAPPPADGEDHTVNGREFIACRRRVAIARDGVPALQFATPGAPPVRAPFRAGEEFEALFIVESDPFEGDTRWWVAADGTRVPAAGTVQKFTRGW